MRKRKFHNKKYKVEKMIKMCRTVRKKGVKKMKRCNTKHKWSYKKEMGKWQLLKISRIQYLH